MSQFSGVDYDADLQTVTFRGDGLQFLLAMFLKAKFGEAFDPEALLNPTLNRLLADLESGGGALNHLQSDHYSLAFFSGIGAAIIGEIKGGRLDWWRLSPADQAKWMAQASRPWRLSEDQQTIIRDHIDAELIWARALVKAAPTDGP